MAIYYRGDEFKGRLFMKFTNAEVASATVGHIDRQKLKHREGEIWSKTDAPVEVRVTRRLLLGLRWQLHEWESFDKMAIQLDVPASTMTIGGKSVVSVSTEKNKLKIMWLDSTWDQWKELHDSCEMEALIETGNKKPQQAAEEKTKSLGKGKGKSKAT